MEEFRRFYLEIPLYYVVAISGHIFLLGWCRQFIFVIIEEKIHYILSAYCNSGGVKVGSEINF